MSPQSLATLPGYVAIRDILDGKIANKSLVNVYGLISGFRDAMKTKGTDYKCQVRLFDSSVDDDGWIAFDIFRPEEELPNPGCGDSQKVQSYGSAGPSLLSTYNTKISQYKATKIPRSPSEASCALCPASGPKDTPPGNKENAFVSAIYHSIDKSRLPNEEMFETMVVASRNVKDKFKLLQDVQEGCFCDIVAQVVRPPHDGGDKMTLWVSDYTENPFFHNFSIGFDESSIGRDGDPFGYTDKYTMAANPSAWPGPFGKRCIQITCWEPHATALRDRDMGTLPWVLIKNLQIRLGHSGANLEGFLREDRDPHGPKIGIRMVNSNPDSENFDLRAKEALQRKRQYERLKKGQAREIKEALRVGQKRKHGGESKTEQKKDNAKSRRNEKRSKTKTNKQGEAREPTEQDVVPSVDLNIRVKCENEDKPASPIAEITKVVQHETTIDDVLIKLPLPFVNLNYRANVRVVDFSPANLADFAYPKKESEYEDLSDDGEESLSNSETEAEDEQPIQRTLDDFTKARNWEWRFFLELEDAAVAEKHKKQRLWVAVDNQSAQLLTGLDACNLRRDKQVLVNLRDKMFTLWGNLEEKKAAAQEAARKGNPPADSDDEDQQEPELKNSGKTQLTNRAFPCCIKQYGIKVAEPEPSQANAGDGKRWRRMFQLFGARIVGE
ncbi:protection of telomeres 1 [Fusarium pseudocircinatum]|uniref:Protection of telomeres protein 1 n=1 Tax=Fusarium pseudocircinatum TaxID=56676 RepID=A0A8H5UXE7_9HYPO|nr:protection of telomeres 1 [Fusarium pseudocircinatum]